MLRRRAHDNTELAPPHSRLHVAQLRPVSFHSIRCPLYPTLSSLVLSSPTRPHSTPSHAHPSLCHPVSSYTLSRPALTCLFPLHLMPTLSNAFRSHPKPYLAHPCRLISLHPTQSYPIPPRLILSRPVQPTSSHSISSSFTQPCPASHYTLSFPDPPCLILVHRTLPHRPRLTPGSRAVSWGGGGV